MSEALGGSGIESIDEKLKAGKTVTVDDAKAALEAAGVADPLSLTPEQQRALHKSRARRKYRALPTFDDIVQQAMLSVTADFNEQRRVRAESDRLKSSRTFDTLDTTSTHSTALIRKQRAVTMIEQSRSMTASYMQASAFFVGSLTSSLICFFTLVIAYETSKTALVMTPMSLFVAWRSWEAYEAVTEDMRFHQQAHEIRSVKRSHIPEVDILAEYKSKIQEKTPLEKKRERKRQQEAAIKEALARKNEASGSSPSAKAEETAATSTSVAPPPVTKSPEQLLNQAVTTDDDDFDLQGDRPMDKYLRRKRSSATEATDAKLKAAAERAKALA